MAPTLEAEILALLRPGGMLTDDTIARNLNVPKWRVARALRTLRKDDEVFQNRRAEWQIAVGQRRQAKQAAR